MKIYPTDIVVVLNDIQLVTSELICLGHRAIGPIIDFVIYKVICNCCELMALRKSRNLIV